MRTAWTATGVALATLAAVAATAGSAIAYTGNGTGTCTGSGPQATTSGRMLGNGPGYGTGMGRAMGAGQGMGQRGSGLNLASVASGTLTSAERTALAGMAEEEKLAHDVYVELADAYPDLVPFGRIAAAETQHLTAVRVLLDRYGIDDPTSGLPAGEFTSARFDALYDTLVDQATTPTDALRVGATVERTDIADLESAMTGLTAPDVLQVYGHLQAASERHLAAFTR